MVRESVSAITRHTCGIGVSADSVNRVWVRRAAKTVGALGWVSFLTLPCFKTLPLLAIFGGLGVATSLGLSVGLVAAVMLTPLLLRTLRARRQAAGAVCTGMQDTA